MRKIFGLMGIIVLGLGLTVARAADKTPDATLALHAGSVAIGLGVSWGGGTLTYQGKDYPISVSGLSVGAVGASSIEASGKVYNLKNLSDFNGNYTAAMAGGAVAGGGGVVTMKNQNGVMVDLVATTQGVSLALGAAGVDMKIKQ
jgi:hypothetical protein